MPDETSTVAPQSRVVILDEAEWSRHLAAETLTGLHERPPATPPVWFYDAVGSELFDRITRLPEYYPTRAERAILTSHATDIAGLAGAESLVELGAGSADKTRLLIGAMRERGSLRRFVPVDCSASALDMAGGLVGTDFPDVAVHSIVADFTAHLPHLPREGRRMLAFLGSTIGNFDETARTRFLTDVAAHLRPGDSFLLGTDLVKPRERLIAAYDDPGGVTAAFNRNALVVMNRTLGADFRPEWFRHEAVWDEPLSRVEMRLVPDRRCVVTFDNFPGFRLELAAGEWIRTEISVKFSSDQVRRELAAAGLGTVAQWTDPAGDFLLTLAAPSTAETP